uniref:C2H2-type domain-containing protein n=1 Tax=Anopheles culicifacies TaxID=139723 RepID=A0A182LY17_9DIPT
MADGGYDPMGHIQTGRPNAYYLYQAAAAALEQQHQQQHQQQEQNEDQSTEEQIATRSRPASDDGHENNNNLPAAANNNLFRSEQKKHKRKRLSAVLDKLHNGSGTVVNHNNNNVGEAQNFKVKCTDSRSSAEDSAEDVFPYSASPRISISPLRLSEVDENNPLQQRMLHQQHALPHDQQLPSPSQISRQTKLDSPQQPMVPLQPSQIKQEDQQYLPPPGSPMPPASIAPKLVLKREDLPDIRRSPAFEHLNGHAPPGFNLNVSPVVEEMPPGSDVAYMCPVCGQLFSLQDRLAKHMASRHKSRTGATDITKSYMCEVCQRSFARSDMLTRHMRLHTGVKPYSCKVCGQIFSRSDHLSTHQRTHTGEKPYKCPQCPYAACRRDMITRHMRTHTRFDQRGGSNGGGSSGGSTSPSMDQKPILLPLVGLSAGRAIKKEASFGGVGGGFVLEAKTES